MTPNLLKGGTLQLFLSSRCHASSARTSKSLKTQPKTGTLESAGTPLCKCVAMVIMCVLRLCHRCRAAVTHRRGV